MTYSLIYAFYIYKDIQSLDDNEAYETHFKCLSYFRDTWDRCVFILSVDDLNNKLINDVKYKLLEIFYDKDITFVIEKNNPLYREGIHFYNYIVSKLDSFEYDEYVMFGHSKGVFNFTCGYNPNVWVSSMYYLNCIYKNYLHGRLNDLKQYYIYGGLLLSKYHTIFTDKYCIAGSFLWLYPKKIYKYVIENNLDISFNYINNLCGIRNIAEYFANILFDESQIDFYNKDYINDDYKLTINTSNISLYDNDIMSYILQKLLFYEDYNDFEEFYKNIK